MSVVDVVKKAGRYSVSGGHMLLLPLAFLSLYPVVAIVRLSTSQQWQAEFSADTPDYATSPIWHPNNPVEPTIVEFLKHSIALIVCSEPIVLVCDLLGAPLVISMTLALVWLSAVCMTAIGVALYALGVGLDHVFSPEPTRLDDPAFDAPSRSI